MTEVNGMLAAVATAAGLGADSFKPEDVTAEALFAAFPTQMAAVKTAAAEGERKRMLDIENAALPGHADLVAKHKADGTKTAADLALAIIGAEKAMRAGMIDALGKDEEAVKGLRSEPANGVPPAALNPHAGLEGETLWKAEYSSDKALKAEFNDEATYVAFRKADEAGRVKILKKN